MSTPPPKYYRPGQFIFHENDPSHTIFLIKKGTVSIRKRKGTAFVEIGRIYSNEVIGELSFFDRSPRSAAAMALTEVEVTEIKFEALDKIFETVPEYFKTIVAAMAERLRKSNDIVRRLERNVVSEKDGTSQSEEGESAADVLAATLDILTPGASAAAAAAEGAPEAAPDPKKPEGDSED